jgi:hypothetical protein
VISIAATLIPNGDDSSPPEGRIRNQKCTLVKDIQTERIGAGPSILHLNKDASRSRKRQHLRLKSSANDGIERGKEYSSKSYPGFFPKVDRARKQLAFPLL